MACPQNKIINILFEIRSIFGRKSVEPNFKKARHDQNLLFADLFSSETFRSATGDKFPVIFCTDLDRFIEPITNQRHSVPDLMKIGFDSGQSSLKATLSLIDTTPDICESKPNTSSFRESSVYKSFIIALAPDLQETYESINFLFDLLNLKKQSDFKLSGDLKCINLILGLQNHASKHHCYCFTYQHGIDQSSIGEFEPWTFELIKANYNAWIQSKRTEQDLQHFYNCRHEPLIERSGPIINVVVPSPLHCLIGIVNKIYKELLKVFPQAEAWPSKLHLVPQVQHGGCDFNGNACHHLLKNIDIFDSLGTTRRNKKVLDPFISCLSSFGDLALGTFSNTLDPDYENLIAQFKKAYMATGRQAKLISSSIILVNT